MCQRFLIAFILSTLTLSATPARAFVEAGGAAGFGAFVTDCDPIAGAAAAAQ
jgi:hypothetical protein